MAEGMIERVGMAIFDAMDVADGLDGTVAKKYARAAIEAMRLPTDEMVRAWDVKCMTEWSDRQAEETWETMIDAALKEEGEQE